MLSVTDQSTARYLASRTLLDGGFSHDQVGRALLALDAEMPEPEAYEPSEKDYLDYEIYLEWLSYKRDRDARTMRTA